MICLTGKTGVSDKVTAFSLGADDFVQKPFDPLELKARVDAKIKKAQRREGTGTWLMAGDLKIDLSGFRVFSPDEREIELTGTEFRLLAHLIRHPEMVFSRNQLLTAVWGDDGAVFDRAVDVHICSLRKKVGPFGLTFKSVPGVGYKIVIGRTASKTAS